MVHFLQTPKVCTLERDHRAWQDVAVPVSGRGAPGPSEGEGGEGVREWEARGNVCVVVIHVKITCGGRDDDGAAEAEAAFLKDVSVDWGNEPVSQTAQTNLP